MLITIFWLFVAHCFGDFVFQTTWMATYKGKNLFVGCVHATVWSACILFALSIASIETYGWMVPYLVLGHLSIDRITAKLKGDWSFYFDQLLHFGQIAFLLALLYYDWLFEIFTRN